jgi:tetratricopeptide (TPR) repeat protein
MRARFRWSSLATPALVLAVAGCAQQQPLPEATPVPLPVPAARSDVDRAIEKRIALARQHLAAGDPRAASIEWQVVTLLAPHDPDYRRELAASRDAAQRGARERLDAARTAQRNGQAERAVEAYVQALANDPGNAEAARALRELDRQRYARIQADRAARARNEMATTAGAAAGDGPGDGYNVDQALEMLAAGDLAGGLRDLKAWVEANPRQRSTRQRIGAAVYDKGRELEAAGAREQALSAYESAVALAGEAPPEWSARIAALKKAIAEGRRERTPSGGGATR